MKLIIAEKPELAEDIANAVIMNFKRQGKGYFIGEEYVCISSFGHILELAEPEQMDEKLKDRSDIKLLPIYFNNWKKVPSKEPYKYKRLKEIKEQLDRADIVIHAGDPDDEGQLLIDEILEYYNYSGKVYRVFVNDNIAKNIQIAFNNMKLNDQIEKNNGLAAYARQMADKTEGINDSRLASIRLKTSGLSIGRVQTPTLALIVNRDNAIENHIKQKYYTLIAKYGLTDRDGVIDFTFKPSEDITEGDKYVKGPRVLEQVLRELEKQVNILVEEKEEIEQPPLPYSLNTLSSDMNEKYGYSTSQVLQITQVLRDKHKAITYNRSDSEYLKEEHFENASHLIPIVLSNIEKDYPVDLTIKSKCFNDDNAPVHHGIIPQEKKVNLEDLTTEEKNVYLAICNRYIIQFLPGVTRKKVSSAFDSTYGTFTYHASKTVDYGYKKYFTDIKTEDSVKYVPPGNYKCFFKDSVIKEEETKPLKKYTEGTLVKDMCNIAKYVTDPQIKKILKLKDKEKKGENGSIGTVATRASIIETLKKRGFIEEQGKYIVSTKLGRDFIEIIPHELKSADLTAKWWLLQEMVREGKKSPNIIMLSVVDEFKKREDTAYLNATLERNEPSICQCPKCKGNIYKRRNKKKEIYYICENYSKGCSVVLNEKINYFDNKLVLTEKKVISLLNGKEVKFSILNKKKEKYNALFKIEFVENNNKTYINLKKAVNK